MKDGLKDEGRNIIQIAFLPEPEEAEGPQDNHVRRGHPQRPRVDVGKRREGPTCLSTPTVGRHKVHSHATQTGLTEL